MIPHMSHVQHEAAREVGSPRGSPLRVLRALVRIVAGLLALVACASVAVLVTGKVRRSAALERVRASGAPVYPSDLRFAPSPNAASFDAWVQREGDVEESFGAFDDGQLPECTESVAALRDTSVPDLTLREDLQFATADPLRADRLTDCQLAVHRAWLAESASTRAWAASLEPGARPDWQVLLSSDLTPNELLTRSGVGVTQRAAEALTVAMLDEAWNGNSEEAVRLCARVFELAHGFREAPNIPFFSALGLHESMATSALQALVLALAPDVDLHRIEAQFDAVPAVERFRFALEGQRAHDNALFRDIAEGADPFLLETWMERLDALKLRWASDWLQWAELEQDERQLALLGQTYARAKPLLEQLDAEGDAWLISSPARSSAELHARFLAQLETTRVLRQALLIAYRDGPDAARAWAREQPDPFGTESLRVRVDPDGVLTVWSVGTNGSDDGAPLPPWSIDDWGTNTPPDHAIRFRPRQVR